MRLAQLAPFLLLLAAACDAVLLPAATGVAPATLADTGNAVMSRFWTALHVPAISVPIWHSAEGLPLGLQLLGALGRITGRVDVEDVLDVIFREFCIGK